MMAWQIIATKTGLDREVVVKGLASRKEAWEWKIMHAEKFTPRILLVEREEEKKPTLKELFTGVALDSWVERAKVKGLNEFKNLHASPEQETLEMPFVWRAFREWVKRNLREDTDAKIILETLDDIDKKFTYTEAQDFLLTTEDRKFAWIRMQFKDVEEITESPLVSEMRKTIEGARNIGITDRQITTALRSMGIELERPTSKGLAEAQKEIARLTEEIKTLQREKIIPEWKPYWTEMQKGMEIALRAYPNEDVYTRLREGRLLLDRAYAGDPYVMMWADARGYTVKDLEDEVMRLRRAVAGVRVPDMRVDVLRMSVEVAEKQAKMPTLLEMETILEGAQKMEKWALERMTAKYGVANVYEFESRVMKLREKVGDPPQEDIIIEPLIITDHTAENLAKLAMAIQTEGWIGFIREPHLRHWMPVVAFKMAPKEPVEETARLVDVAIIVEDGYRWDVRRRKAERLLTTIIPRLTADKWETARYILNMAGIRIPDTYIRPTYYAIVEHKRSPIFLYKQFADFPLKYGHIVDIGQTLPKPLKLIPLKFTPNRTPLYWYQGRILHREDLY